MKLFSRPAVLLRRALFANSAFSLLSALAIFATSAAVAAALGMPEAAVRSLGLELLCFAVLVGFVGALDASRAGVRAAVWVIGFLDVLWVVGSVALLLSPTAPPTALGTALVVVVALVVADLAFLQLGSVIALGRRHRIEA